MINNILLMSIVLGLLMGAPSGALAHEVISAMGVARSYPFSGNLELQYKYEKSLWGGEAGDSAEPSFWRGFVSPRVLVATHGTFEWGLGVNPTSFIELNAASSWTSRYYKLKKFDCDQQICDGVVTRTKYGIRFILGKSFEEGNLFVLPSFQWIRSRHQDNSKPLADELEINIAGRGGEDFFHQSHLLGFKRDQETWGLLYRRGEFQDSHASSTAEYLIYRRQNKELTTTYGLGQYESDLNSKELSLIFAISWQRGASLGLF